MRDQLIVDFGERPVRGDGSLGAFRSLEVDEASVQSWTDAEEREVLQLLLGNGAETRHEARLEAGRTYARSAVRSGMYAMVLPRLAATGRFFRDDGREIESEPLVWVDDEVEASLAVEQSDNPPGFRLWGRVRLGEEVVGFDALDLVLSTGLILHRCRLFIAAPEVAGWVARLRRTGPVYVAHEERDAFLVRLGQLDDLPEVDLPPELHWSRVVAKPRPVLSIDSESEGRSTAHLFARVAFDYGGVRSRAESRSSFAADPSGRRLFRRDRKAEAEAIRGLEQQGLKQDPEFDGAFLLPRSKLLAVVRDLVAGEWSVESGGQPIRRAKSVKSKVRSSIDWFELEALVDFDGVQVAVPELLAKRSDADLIPLPDGSLALPPVWLDRYLALARTGRASGGNLRFSPAQAGIIDALLTGQDDAEVDVKFSRMRRRKPVKATAVREPTGFRGQLRPYQKEGVAWLRALAKNDCGGCLADDMGLGKTVQVLCWLQELHRNSPCGPSLVVVPRSLVHNWQAEAKKFTDLRCSIYGGSRRDPDRLGDTDLVITTYGTLRTDILKLLDLKFETVILDEAQAIKNPRSQVTKAAKLTRSRLRLAISGTPIENGLDELWSIFDFANPGMLGPMDEFADGRREQDDGWLSLLSRALQPLMLRRTKTQVLTDLPGKTEQAVLLDLDEDERRRYAELLTFYRSSLKEKIDRDGMAAARFQVLEALLRLRQAACHPGLLDPTRVDEPSAKVDYLVDQIETLAQQGHKCLVFSQFTGLLAVVQRALVRRGLEPAYLDGQTRNRAQAVKEFQADPTCPAFLISLKAGGCGLNLTSAGYVFLLDPWWNPAVEAQAIDRAHRMGQRNHVFAYRLIARDTVEEKIVALQADKRRLADAVIDAPATVADFDQADLDELLA